MSSKEYPYADILRAIITDKVVQFQRSNGVWVDQSAEDTLFEISKKIYEPERYREKPRVMVINGNACVAFTDKMPPSGTTYFVPDLALPNSPNMYEWHGEGDSSDLRWFKAGLVHLTTEGAIEHAKALVSITAEMLVMKDSN